MKAILLLVLCVLPILIGLVMPVGLRSNKAIADSDQEIVVIHCMSLTIAVGLIGFGIGVGAIIAVIMWLL